MKIGDPNATITGPHTYVITYTVTDGLRVITEDDAADPAMPDAVSAGDVELYWDVIGTGWDVPIGSAKATVSGPGAVLSAVCYVGAAGSDARCPAALGEVHRPPGAGAAGRRGGHDDGRRLPGGGLHLHAEREPEPGAARPTRSWASSVPSSPPGSWPPCRSASPWRAARADAGAPVPGAPPQYAPPDDLTPGRALGRMGGPGRIADPRVLVATLLEPRRASLDQPVHRRRRRPAGGLGRHRQPRRCARGRSRSSASS